MIEYARNPYFLCLSYYERTVVFFFCLLLNAAPLFSVALLWSPPIAWRSSPSLKGRGLSLLLQHYEQIQYFLCSFQSYVSQNQIRLTSHFDRNNLLIKSGSDLCITFFFTCLVHTNTDFFLL